MTAEIAAAVMRLYDEMDHEACRLRVATGLDCPPGCGACCHSTCLRITPLEMLPAAQVLFTRGEAEHWLARVAAAASPRCVFFVPDAVVADNGRCLIYPWRPVLCRLFGWAAVLDKRGKPVLAVCRRIKELAPETSAAARRAVSAGLGAPVLPAFACRVYGVYPRLGELRLPVNEALAAALEWVGLRQSLGSGTTGPSPDPHPPRHGHLPGPP
jgi:Fe-S-cluster containining protein